MVPLVSRLIAGGLNFASGAARGFLRGAGVPAEKLWQLRGVAGYLGAAVGAAPALVMRGVGTGAIATARRLPQIAGFGYRTAERLARDISPAAEVSLRGFAGISRRMIRFEKPSLENFYTGMRLSPLGKAIALGAVGSLAVQDIVRLHEEQKLGYIVPGVQPLPSLEYEGVANRYDTGADGELVLALNRLRHGY